MKRDVPVCGLYDLRLKVSQKYPLVHINEYLYTEIENDTRVTGRRYSTMWIQKQAASTRNGASMHTTLEGCGRLVGTDIQTN